jgi:alpha-glucosidase
MPISAVHLDIDYMDGFRVFTADPSRFPDLHRLCEDLLRKNIRVISIIDPGVKKDPSYPIYQDGLSNGVFCKSHNNKVLHGVVWPGWAAFPDFTDPIARKWWGNQYLFYLGAGISGFWHDMNEPVSFCAWGKNTLPDSTIHHLDGRHGNHSEAHNVYGLLMNRAAYESLQQLNPNKRSWLISRSGWAGLQQYAWNWTGDVASTWEAFRQTIIIMMGLSLSGHFFAGSDIGGFSGNPSAELYLRWFQFASFCPFFRTHSAIGTERREPWSFGEPYTSIIRHYMKLRYQLIPYMYTLARESHLEGIPVIRPMFWNNPDISHLWDIDDQFFLGDDILVAPVLHPASESREVVLPPGGWYDYWDETYYPGQTTINIPVSMEHIPIMLRAGSILPLEISNDKLELHIYQAKNQEISGAVYSDSGDGYDSWRVDHFICSLSNGTFIISQQTKGDFPWPYKKLSIILHGDPVPVKWIGEQEVSIRHVSGSNL